MGKKLAIKGHPTRNKEVIELLEMMGGKNTYGYTGDMESLYFYIYDDTIIYGSYRSFLNDKYVFFTLEEFLAKYPFKIGDSVIHTKFGADCNDYPIIIKSMRWTGTTMEYTFDGCLTCHAKYLKMWTAESDVVISGINLNRGDYADEVEINLGDYEIKVRNGKTFAVLKRPKYPTTYEDCCKNVFGLMHGGLTIDTPMHYSPLIIGFTKLLICRDAYWKISGEQMGLDNFWMPDWNSGKPFYCISVSGNIIGKGKWYTDNKILAFPTEEMRNAFYENFKELIEQCKELL